MGSPRLFIIAADGQGELYYDSENKLKVRQAVDDAGHVRLRAEIPEYDEKATGKKKIFDDAVDAWRGMAASFFVPAAPMTMPEKIERALPETLRVEAIQAGIESGERDAQGAWAARDFAIREAEKKLNKPNTSSPWLRHMHRK